MQEPHIAQMVAALDNDELAKILPNAPPGAGGGYFIVKSSWDECHADRGYVYVPFEYVSRRTWNAVVVTGATQ